MSLRHGGLVILMLAVVECIPLNLTTIRYRFTSCGQQGRTGPNFQMCMNEYQNTTLANTEVFFFFDNLHRNRELFQGGQGFKVPRTGRYNITLAGAAGGRGICNTDYGRGLVWKGQAEFTAGEELLILVGQRGSSPCEDTNFPGIDEEVCQNPPTTELESSQCNQTWYSMLSNSIPSDLVDGVHDNLGGGGGGGASMIRVINHTSEEEIPMLFPIAVAGGGGGSPSFALYEVVNQLQTIYAPDLTFPANSTLRERYRSFTDAKHELFNPFDPVEGFGVRGYIGEHSFYRAGSGGGYLTAFRNSADIDGGYLNAEDNFAEGGFDCTRQLPEFFSIEPPGTHGGFGGGGGQCGGGGSGGGFTGGGSFGSRPEIPGQGGFYYYVGQAAEDIDQDARNLTEIGYQTNEMDDGYVEIVLENCGCSGTCVVNEDEDTFQCFCSDNNTVLLPNGLDCARDILLGYNVSQDTAVLINDVTFTPVYLNSSVSLFALNTQAHIGTDGNSGHGTESCCLVLIGPTSNAVLASNVLRADGVFDLLSMIYSADSGKFVQSKYFPSLPDPVVVAGALLVSTGECRLTQTELNATVSTDEVHATPFQANLLQEMNEQQLYSLAQSVLGLVVDTSTKPAEEPSIHPPVPFGEHAELVWTLLCTSVVVLLIAFVVIGGCLCIRRKQHRKKLLVTRSEISKSTSSMLHNNVYYAYKPGRQPTNAQRVGYVPTHPPRAIEWHDYEVLCYSASAEMTDMNEHNDPISTSARFFAPKYGVTAPIHDFTSYNQQRVGYQHSHSWEYPRSKLTYLRELGEGQFGKVLLMKANGIANFGGVIPVAVKTLSCKAPHMLEKFIEETNLMKKFSHPNIVSLLGVSSHDVNEDSAPLMILEYMPFGDLQEFLVNNKPQAQQTVSLVSQAHFFSIGRDVGEALSFLASQGYVHRDVAARNCLVGPDLRIKIADFGLARAIQTKNYYRVVGKSVLPVKWMAPESLMYGIFSTASDIWSYGVLLWEVVTFGETPLENCSSDDIIKMADNKALFHPRPADCPDEIYTVMCGCHMQEPDDRIAFDEILNIFSKDNIAHYFEESVQI